MRRLIFFIFTLIVASAYCGGSSSSSNPPPSGNPPQSSTISVTGINISKTETGLLSSGTETLRALVFPRTAANQNIKWSTSDSSVVTVNSNGLITAGVIVGTAQATITATAEDTTNGNYSATCIVNVSENPIPVIGLTLAYSSLKTYVGGSFFLSPKFNPSNATNQGVTWQSSFPGTATVNPNGKVNGISEGSCKIHAIADDGGVNSPEVWVDIYNYYKNITGTITNWNTYKPTFPGTYLKAAIFEGDTERDDLSGICTLDPNGNFNLVIGLDETTLDQFLTEATNWDGFTIDPPSGVKTLLSLESDIEAEIHIYESDGDELAGFFYATTDTGSNLPNSKAELQYASDNVIINGSFTEQDGSDYIKYIFNNVTFPSGWSWMIFTTSENIGANNDENDPGFTTNVTCVPFTNQSGFKFYGGDF